MLIGIPTGDAINPYTMGSVMRLIVNNGCDFTMSKSIFISSNRNLMAMQFLDGEWIDTEDGTKRKYTHLLYIDSDMVLPDNMDRLINTDKDIISGLYYGVNNSDSSGALHVFGTARDLDDNFLNEADVGIVEAGIVPGGCLMVSRKVLEKMQYPWFNEVYTKENKGFVGEDCVFSRKARDAGFKLYVDTHVKCGHMKEVRIYPTVSGISVMKRPGSPDTFANFGRDKQK